MKIKGCLRCAWPQLLTNRHVHHGANEGTKFRTQHGHMEGGRLFSLSLPLLSHTLNTLGETYPLFNPNDATKVVQSVQLFDTLVYKQKTTFKVGDWIQHIGYLNHFTNT